LEGPRDLQVLKASLYRVPCACQVLIHLNDWVHVASFGVPGQGLADYKATTSNASGQALALLSPNPAA
jgi:hypothetical protein